MYNRAVTKLVGINNNFDDILKTFSFDINNCCTHIF